jgi:hypothetical protein
VGFLGDILGALGSLASEIGQILVYIFNLVIAIAQFIWNGLLLVAQYALDGLKAVGGFFRHLWDGFFKGIFQNIWKGILKVHDWLESHLRPLIDFLKKVQKYIDKIYKTYVRPFIIAIQRIRRVISILRLLHIHIADGLDKILAQVQRDIQGTFLQIRGILNTTIDLLNIVADPTKLLRRPTLILSLRRVWHSYIRQFTGLPPAYFFPSPRKSAPRGLGILPANFDANNPEHNPPPSYYLGLDSDVPTFDFLGDGDVIGDGSTDDVAMWDYFNAEAYGDPDCLDPRACMVSALDKLLNAQGRS